MKKVLSLALLLIATTTIFSQEFSPQVKYGLGYFIGKYNNSDLYVTTDGSERIKNLESTHGKPLLLTNKSKQALVSYRDGIYNVEKEWQTTLFKPEKWFLYKDTLYSAVLKNVNGFVIVQLNKFSATFRVTDSITLTKNPVLKYSEINVRFDQVDDYLTVLCSSNKNGNTGFFTVFDLRSDEIYNQSFEIANFSSLVCGGVAINNSAELLAIFERVHDTGIANSKNDFTEEAYLLSCTNKDVQLTTLRTTFGDQFRNSFRLCKIDETKVLLGGLVFTLPSKNMMGYITINLQFGTTVLSDEQILTADLSRPELWVNKEGLKVVEGGQNQILKDQYLKEIRKLSDNSFVFVSEGCSVFGSPHTAPDNIMNNIVVFKDIIVSRIGNGQIQWTNKTKFREDIASGYIMGMNSTKASFFLHLNEVADNLSVYYPEQKKSFNESGALKDKRTTGVGSRTTTAVLTLNLTNGKGEAKALFSDFSDLPGEVMLPACSHISTEGNSVIVTWRELGGPSHRQIVLVD